MLSSIAYWSGIGVAIFTVIAINMLPKPPIELAYLAGIAILTAGAGLLWSDQ